MILSAIFHFFKTVFGYLIKFIAWLLVALSLWVPLLYSLIFIIICGLTETSIIAIQGWFWAGLALSFVGSFLVSTFIYERRISRKKRQRAESATIASVEKVKEKQTEPIMKKRGDDAAVVAAQQDENETQQNFLPDENAQSGTESSQDNIGKPSLNNQTSSSLMERLKAGAMGLKPTDTAAKHNFISYNPVNGQSGYDNPSNNNFDSNFNNSYNNNYHDGFANNDQNGFSGGFRSNSGTDFGNNSQNGFSAGQNFAQGRSNYDNYSPLNERRGSGRSGFDNDYSNYGGDVVSGRNAATDSPFEGGERPNIFATRSDPTVLIYEYADRLEYYKRTRAGLLLFKTRQKEASGE